MKKILFLFTFIAIGLTYFYFHNSSEENDWTTFQKKDQDIKRYRSTKAEKALVKVQTKTSKEKRAPASIKRKPLLLAGQIMPKDLTFKNSISKGWQKKMAHHLMRFQEEETKLLVYRVESLVILDKGQGLNVEKVHIKYITKEGRHYGYHALVNSETGALIRTWDRLIHEGINHKRIKMRASNI